MSGGVDFGNANIIAGSISSAIQPPITTGLSSTLTAYSESRLLVSLYTNDAVYSVYLPSAYTLRIGHQFEIINDCARAIVYVYKYDGITTVCRICPGIRGYLTCSDNDKANGAWEVDTYNAYPDIQYTNGRPTDISYTTSSTVSASDLYNGPISIGNSAVSLYTPIATSLQSGLQDLTNYNQRIGFNFESYIYSPTTSSALTLIPQTSTQLAWLGSTIGSTAGFTKLWTVQTMYVTNPRYTICNLMDTYYYNQTIPITMSAGGTMNISLIRNSNNVTISWPEYTGTIPAMPQYIGGTGLPLGSCNTAYSVSFVGITVETNGTTSNIAVLQIPGTTRSMNFYKDYNWTQWNTGDVVRIFAKTIGYTI